MSTFFSWLDGKMAAHSLHYHHRHFSRFGRVGWNPRCDVSVETMPLRYDWGCRTYQTASHIHVIYTSCLWTPSTVVNGHMAAQAHHYHHRCFPRFRRVDWNPSRWCKCSETMSLHHSWGCTTFQTASHIHVIHIWSDWAPLTAVNGYGSTLIWLPLMVGRSLRSWIFGLLAIWLLITSSEEIWGW